MILLQLISWPYFRKHVLRTLLTTAGIVLGVAVFVGMHTANQSVLFAFNNTIDRIAGKTQIEVTAGETGFDEEVLDRVQSASTVRVAVPVIESVVSTRQTGVGSVLVLGVDMTGDRSLRDYDLESGDEAVVDDPLVFLAQPDSIIVTRELAEKLHLSVNAALPLTTALGERRFTVRGIMKSTGLTTAFGGNLAVTDIYAAQKMFGRGRKFDRIDLAVKEGRSVAECERELGTMLGPGLQVEPPAARGQQFESMLTAYTIMIRISSVLALVIGMFIIYNSFAIAVTQRRSEIGILRALGATRRQIRWLFLGESVVTGLVGSAAGIVLGLVIARGIAASIAGVITDVYGVAQYAQDVAANPSVLVGALAMGLATSVVAALIPARNAANVDPVKALQKGRYQMLSAGENRTRLVLAGVASVVSAACLVGSESRLLFYAGYLLAILVALLLTPLLSLAVARALRPMLKVVRPVEGALAADSLIQAPRRTSASVAALMLSLALVIGFAGMARASYNSIIGWMNQRLNPDLFVMPSSSVVIRTIRFPPAVATELAAVPGVKLVQGIRNPRIIFRQTPIMIVAVDVKSLATTTRQVPVAGDASRMYERTAAGRGLMVSDNLSRLKHLSLGDVVDLPAPNGVIRLPIVGIVVDYSDQQGTVIMDLSLYRKYWNDDTLNAVRVYVEPGAPIADVKERIARRFAGERQVFVLTNPELKSYILKITDQWFALSSVQMAIAVIVAILGIVNTLTVSITDRRRELGVLKAVGGLHRQIRGTVWIEALSIGLIGLVLGLALGAVNLYYTLQVVQHDIAGMRFDYEYPLRVAAALVPTILAAALVGALWPAESAVRGSLVEALEYE